MKDIRNRKIANAILIFFILSIPVLAHDNNEQEKQSQQELEKKAVKTNRIIIPRLNGSVKLDGLSEEKAWQGIKPLPVVMHAPNFLDEPTEKTEILVAYDDDYLYVAGRLYDREPSKIQCTSKKRDDMKPNSDWFGILVDTFNDKENALAFFTTPTGLRLDLTIFNDAQGEMPFNTDWNTFWDVEIERNNDGWFAEMRIPLSSLQFQEKDGICVMGLISWRWIARKNESISFPAISPDWGMFSLFKPSQAQEVIFQGIHKKKPLYIAPYALAGFGHSYELNEAETAYERSDDPARELGLDLKYGLTSNLTLDVTLNTDFAQVEADDEQVNLTRFSLFFPEKRLFFQERSSTFDFNLGGPNSLFYSRRIGIYEGQSVRIYGGARLVGRVGPWDLGFLNMQTAAIEDLPSENFGVLRIRRQVFNPYSYLGGIITSRIGADNTFNIAYGLDGIFRISRNDYLSFKLAQTFENGEENKLTSLDQARMGVSWERRSLKGFGYDFSFSRVGSAFNPGMGFQMRENYTRFGDRLLYGWRPGEKSPLLRHHVFLDGSLLLENTGGSTESAEIGPGWEFETKSGAFGNFAFKMFWEDVPEEFELSDDAEVPIGKYSFYGLQAFFLTPMTKLFFTENRLDVGTFYDGWRLSLSVSPWWSISPSLELSGMYQFNRVVFPDRDQKFTAHIARLRLSAMLSIKFSATAFIQYNSANNNVITNIRIRYNPREGNDLYLVYNEGINTNRFGQSPVPPATGNRAVMIKYSYTFNF